MATDVAVAVSVALEGVNQAVEQPAIVTNLTNVSHLSEAQQVPMNCPIPTTISTTVNSDVIVTRAKTQQVVLQQQLQHQQLQQQHQQLLIDSTQTHQQVQEVEAALADLVSGVVAQTAQSPQVTILEQSTASEPITPTSTGSSNPIPPASAPWAWHFAIAGVASSAEGESTSQNPFIGFVHTVEDAYDVMRSYEVHTTSKFVQVRTVQDFGKDLDCLKYKHRVRFEERKAKDDLSTNRLPLKDTPFLLLGTKWFECQHGRDYHVNFKRKRIEAIETGNIVVKRRNKAAKSKKVGCLAKVWMKDVLVFPKKKLRKDVKSGKKMLSKEIRGGTVKGERRIYVFLPEQNLHNNHPVGEASGEVQRVDPQVIDNIYWLVGQGIHSTREIQLHLERFVKDDLFRYQTPPSLTNRRFFPTNKDIRNHMIAARKGRLPPKDRAEIAKQSSSAATMCASNKLAYPKTNQTTKCRSLSKQIMSLSKRIKNPIVMAEAAKKMEDLVAFLRAGAQKEQRVLRMETRAREPSVLQSTTLERPPLRKRQRVRKGSEDRSGEEKVAKCDPKKEGAICTQGVSPVDVGLDQGQSQGSKESNQELSNEVEISLAEQTQQVELSDQGQSSQHIDFQSQTPGLVEISLPLEPSSNPGASQAVSDLQKIFQGASQFQSVVGPSDVMVQVADSRFAGFAASRANLANDSEDSSAARALIQLDAFRTAELSQGTSFLTTPIQFHTSPTMIPSDNIVYTSSSNVQYPPTTTS